NLQRQRDVLRDLGLEAARPWQLVVLVGALAFAWGVALLGVSRAGRVRADPARALWLKLCRRLAHAGLPRQPSEGPLAYAARAAQRWPRWARTLERIGDTYATLRYGPADGRAGRRIAALRAGLAALPSARRMRAE
ncbi:MAG TPA: DUF4129 domain-containing protein, partial [Casimicrobiaceae bacterium]|nr:DUF4129 domain-containing protein [Casimicrobiaceae bacterium]